MSNKNQKVDYDYTNSAVSGSGRKSTLSMFMVMLGFTFFSASMWVGQQLADGLDFGGFIGALLLGGAILGIYTGLLGYVGAETGMSLDLLARKAFGLKGSYLPSAMISFTQIGWFGVGVAMFAIPVAKEFFGGSTAATWVLVIIAGISVIGGLTVGTILTLIYTPSMFCIFGSVSSAEIGRAVTGSMVTIRRTVKSIARILFILCSPFLYYDQTRIRVCTYCRPKKKTSADG